MQIGRLPGPVIRHAVYLEGNETVEDFLELDWESLSVPEEWNRERIEREIKRGVIFGGNGIAQFVKGPYFSWAEAAGEVTDKSPVFLPWGGKVWTVGFDNYPLIPSEIVFQILAFFREVYKEHKSEAYASLWMNPETLEWKVGIPEQQVSAGGVSYEAQPQIEDGFVYMGDIHSHAGMGASHSGVDDADEFKDVQRNGIHITIGNLDRPFMEQSWSCRIIIGPVRREKIPLTEVVAFGAEQTFPAEWMQAVNKKTLTVTTSQTTPWEHYHRPFGNVSQSVLAETPSLVGMTFDTNGEKEWIEAWLETLEEEEKGNGEKSTALITAPNETGEGK